MLLSNSLRRFVWVGVSLLVCLLIGCGSGGNSGQGAIMPPEGGHIRQMQALYNHYKSATKKAPASPEALKEWAQKQPPEKIGISGSLDDVFISPRDHEPYGIAPPPKGQQQYGPQRVVIYEKVGVKGRHMVANGMGYSQEMDDAALQTFVPNP